MPNDPFRRQHETSLSNRRKILTTVAEKPSTFSELLQSDAIGLSRPILSKYLRELRNEGVIERQIVEGRIEYRLTEDGRDAERLRKELYAAVFELVSKLIIDLPGRQAMHALAKTARDDPILFERFLQFLKDFMLISTSKETLRWMRQHPKNQWNEILRKALKNIPKTLRQTDSGAQVFNSLQLTLNIMRSVLASDVKGS